MSNFKNDDVFRTGIRASMEHLLLSTRIIIVMYFCTHTRPPDGSPARSHGLHGWLGACPSFRRDYRCHACMAGRFPTSTQTPAHPMLQLRTAHVAYDLARCSRVTKNSPTSPLDQLLYLLKYLHRGDFSKRWSSL